jgi:hypothetical protein
MRRERHLRHADPTMRIVVDVERSGSGRIVGTVTADGRHPDPFEGWLDFVRLLEDRIDPAPKFGEDT